MDKRPEPNLIPPHGGYRTLKSYQGAEIVYDATIAFCDRFFCHISTLSVLQTSRVTQVA